MNIRHLRRRGLLGAGALMAASLVVAACSAGQSGSGGSSVAFQLHWSWSPSTAGFAIAQEEGYYTDAGVDVEMTEGKGSGNAVQLVTTGRADMGIADAVAIAQQAQEGAPLLVVATVNQTTNISLQALNSSGITQVADLRGRTVAVPPGGAFSFLFPVFLQENGLSPEDVEVANMPFESMVPSLISGQVDAIVGGQDSYVALAAQDQQFTDIAFGDHGVDAVAHSIFTTQRYAEENPEQVEAVVAASLRGWGQARQDPDQALADIQELQPDTVQDNARTELDVLLPLLCTAGAQHVGVAGQDRWAHSMDLLVRADLLEQAPDPATLVSYDYLPPEEELTSCS